MKSFLIKLSIGLSFIIGTIFNVQIGGISGFILSLVLYTIGYILIDKHSKK